MSLKHPIHPGRVVRDDCLPELELTVGAAAQALGVSRQTLDKIVNGRGSVTPDMAIRFEKVFGATADMWLRLQTAYDLATARKRDAEIVATVRVPAMKKDERTGRALIDALQASPYRDMNIEPRRERMAVDQALPFEPLVPKAKTERAMRRSDDGRQARSRRASMTGSSDR